MRSVARSHEMIRSCRNSLQYVHRNSKTGTKMSQYSTYLRENMSMPSIRLLPFGYMVEKNVAGQYSDRLPAFRMMQMF